MSLTILEKREQHMAEYKILKTEGRAKRAEFKTVHGTIQTPVFMNVGTVGAIKGAVSTSGPERDRHTGRAVQYLSPACTYQETS